MNTSTVLVEIKSQLKDLTVHVITSENDKIVEPNVIVKQVKNGIEFYLGDLKANQIACVVVEKQLNECGNIHLNYEFLASKVQLDSGKAFHKVIEFSKSVDNQLLMGYKNEPYQDKIDLSQAIQLKM